MTTLNTLIKEKDYTIYNFLRQNIASTRPELIADSSPAWQAVVNTANIIDLPAEMGLMKPNTDCEQFILLLSGRVRVFQQTPDDREVTLYRINAGDLCVLNINGLLHRKSFGAFATTETNVKALVLSRENFIEGMGVSSAFREYILINLTDRYHDMLEMMEDAVFESLDTRLICMLGRLSRGSGSDEIYITHQELARELGSSREVISRLLKGLERKGCISLGRGVIHMAV